MKPSIVVEPNFEDMQVGETTHFLLNLFETLPFIFSKFCSGERISVTITIHPDFKLETSNGRPKVTLKPIGKIFGDSPGLNW